MEIALLELYAANLREPYVNIDCIILAAGLSTRMQANKLLLPFRGKPILQHTIDLASSLAFSSFTLVSREETLAGVQVPEKFTVIVNRTPELGQSVSMRRGLKNARGEGFMFFQGDQPLLDEATVTAVINMADAESIVVPRHAGKPGNPVFFPAKFKNELMAVRGDHGGRGVRDSHSEACRYVEVSGPEPMWDVDTKEKYEILLRGRFPTDI